MHRPLHHPAQTGMRVHKSPAHAHRKMELQSRRRPHQYVPRFGSGYPFTPESAEQTNTIPKPQSAQWKRRNVDCQPGTPRPLQNQPQAITSVSIPPLRPKPNPN
jgi:hypothetical protein